MSPERERIIALHEYGLLDAPAGDELAAVVRLAALAAGLPAATLNIIDEHQQRQLTSTGFAGSDSARADSMCAVRFADGELVHVPDARIDPVYAGNPWVTGRLGQVRCYVSAPLLTPEGFALGTLCLFDTVPRRLAEPQLAGVRDAARLVVALFERRRQSRLNAELAAESGRRGQFIRTLLETIDVAVIAADPTGHLTVFNRAAREWHGLDADPTLDPADFSDRYALFDADGATPLAEDRIPLLRALREGAVHNAEMVIRRRAGDPLHLTVTGHALADPDGTLLGAVVAMNDVTADRVQRRALQEASAELAERGAQLAATISELQRSNSELTDFATAVSHDLASPLAAVHGCLELLERYPGQVSDEQARRWTAMALRAVVRMEQLIRSLLDYARAGHVRLVPRPVALGDVLADAMADLGTVMRDVDADVAVAELLPTVDGDATLLRQLLQNLIGNAVKYQHPDRRCRVTVRARPYEDAWLVSVADNGIGIPPGHRERIFTMFAQVEPDKLTGHGIGLATCQRIVDRHGGAIWAEETPGGGTTISFTLPTG